MSTITISTKEIQSQYVPNQNNRVIHNHAHTIPLLAKIFFHSFRSLSSFLHPVNQRENQLHKASEIFSRAEILFDESASKALLIAHKRESEEKECDEEERERERGGGEKEHVSRRPELRRKV